MSKQVETLKKELNEMYRKAFENCEKCNYEHCSARRKKSKCKIKYDYAAHLGEKYDEGEYKVLCVGKEGYGEHKEVENAIPIFNPDTNKKCANPHYLGTIYTLALLDGKEPASATFGDLKEFNKIHEYYCLTNYFKCAFLKENDDPKNVHGLSVTKYMKDHCYEILLKEIEILKPDLVVIQGKFTTNPFWNALEKEYEAEILYENAKGNISLYKYTLKNQTFCILWSNHPASWVWTKTLDDFKKAIDTFKKEFAKNKEENSL